MDKNIKKIGDELRRITHTGFKDRFPVMSGTVIAGSTDTSAMTCTVRLSVDTEDMPTPDVQITALLMSTEGFVLYPADNSSVLVCEIDGPGSQWGIIQCSQLVKATLKIGSSSITMTNGLIQFNDGSKNGLVNGADVKTKLNNMENDLNDLKGYITALSTALTALGTTPLTGPSLVTAAGSLFTTYPTTTLAVTAESDIEETTVKH